MLGIIINVNCYAKYVIEQELKVANIKIDGKKPKISIMEVKNSNIKYPKYASKKHDISIKIKVEEENIKINNFDKQHIKIYVDKNEKIPSKFNIVLKNQTDRFLIYDLNLKGINSDGNLKVKILNNTIIDMGNQSNDEAIFDTGIIIDNTPPVANFSQIKLEKGVIKAQLDINECIQDVVAWNISDSKKRLTKNFECNVKYPLKIHDYAYNYSEPLVNITKATNIKIKYGAINENYKQDYGQENGDMAGKRAIDINPQNRVEAMLFYYDGEIENDFIQIQAYAHTYWGEGTRGMCYTYETWYNSGYNPSSSTYYSLKNGKKVNYNGEYHILLGGTAMNRAGNKGNKTENKYAIPSNVATQHLFGISALRMKLRDTSYYSIVYQVWVENYGWLPAKSDDIETTYAHDKPIGGYRVALIPKTEKKYLIDYWNNTK